MLNDKFGHTFSITIPSSRFPMAIDTYKHISDIGLMASIKDGTNYPSFSKLINDCVSESKAETIVICNDKARPRYNDFFKTLHLIDKGYGFVGLYCFGFFAFKKELFRRIGPLDERFIGGNYEDSDFLRRLNEANIACYEAYEIPYLEGSSSWNTGMSQYHFYNKWNDYTQDNKICTRLLPEETYNYDFGEITNCEFLPWSHSILKGSEDFLEVKIL
jgi:GT2 family glycosyltransferase